MSENNDICERCGGAKTTSGLSKILAITPRLNTFKICTCPSPEPKHDGKLDEDGSYTVSHSHGAWGFEGILLDEGKRLAAILRPSEALSLLAWLEQERETLEKLAREQE